MTTGPESFREAERLANLVHRNSGSSDAVALGLVALTRATLALAAATAMSAPVDGAETGMGSPEFAAWYEVAGVKPQPKAGESR
ncbi:hypothetical protein WB388_08750 [Streptomyces brasiliscabiei]|uniref:Uncharacterized protein n=1 Tax=Streptomyces brasiliscabiei TaxID=2736302 RepID=A0ABU8G9U4_9ACTN